MKTIVFFLEEPSAGEMLNGLLPSILPPEYSTRFIIFRGKQDLERQLEKRLRGWQLPDSIFVVLRDQDSGDCETVRANLKEICRRARNDEVLVRVACRELESFYLGDLKAVEMGLGLRGLASKQGSRKFRAPDRLGSPSRELYKLTGDLYQKIAGARVIAPHLDPHNNRSHSFNALVSGIKRLVEES
ncbi:MAG: DUF4276 family protein [Syntrophobacteraceae bacterium]